jgi:hypothetical protein
MELLALKNKIIASFTGSEQDLEEVLNMVEEDQEPLKVIAMNRFT